MKKVLLAFVVLCSQSGFGQAAETHEYMEDHKAMVPGGTEVRLPLNRYFANGAERKFTAKSTCQFIIGDDPSRGKFISGSNVLILPGDDGSLEAHGPSRPLRRLFVGADPQLSESLASTGSGWVRRRAYGPMPDSKKYWVELSDYLIPNDLSTITAFVKRVYVLEYEQIPANASSDVPAGLEPSSVIECGGGTV